MTHGRGGLVEEGVHDGVRRPGGDEELADHRTERDEDADIADGAAEAGGEGGEGVDQRDTGDERQAGGAEHEGEERVDLRPHDEDDDQRDADDRGDHEA